jgi:F-type H+-transporting ATPase subunit delta
MRDTTIARNYAETLLLLARKAEDVEGWGRMIGDVGDAMDQDKTLRGFLVSPKVSVQRKNAVLAQAYGDRSPRLFVRFLQSTVSHGRQMLIPVIAREYASLLDQAQGRVHAHVTVARATEGEDANRVSRELSRVIGKDVVSHFSVNPAILGGVIVRVGDRVMDGSVRRRLAILRRRMHAGAMR